MAGLKFKSVYLACKSLLDSFNHLAVAFLWILWNLLCACKVQGAAMETWTEFMSILEPPPMATYFTGFIPSHSSCFCRSKSPSSNPLASKTGFLGEI